MKADKHPDRLQIRLSRRNLLSLLAKLDGKPPGSHCELFKNTDAGWVFVKAEEDAAHYGSTVPGEMHPDTEEAIK